MPNITIHIPADKMPPDEALADLTEHCAELCTGILRAALGNVHILYVAVRHGRGHPVFAEIHYRLEPFRTPPVMERFMKGLDDAIKDTLGLTARIRCFGYAASSIHARN
ncbi:hypothetical protein [Rhodospirillum rubrum]|uniref:Uncharacterized protein n=1 Tax=Rhodospirillum rubrum (strain ATCC 11170 / ATH 1.1.1 / DSM 467 / LMG 4362 / NCIMB 8255 / S1) TaxID=269796 RepID=Q2RYG1_RHORT|nr:hypothetical protein [Rhodospirillum rubrum]ABC20834.1 conserved hypothetical protein [Rhodospirillum rubrum ATCC 11170]AEO46501.1 hypothetical protein F11_00150 [Rhodospirillum rubrum F11]MBK5956357.1 hypothetical protein [Rhodospirillum rubrum]QXG80537.1 hypothetical protein KUL73_00150 [Rhodospirillum rubrum]HAQ00585.1 hypothetical protein [Rhodospirillum rubrum]